jgi:hypothetical protein
MSKIKILKLVIRFIIFEQHINSYSRSVVHFVQSAVRLKYSDTGRVNAVPNAYQPEMNISTQIIYLEAGIPVHKNMCYSVSTSLHILTYGLQQGSTNFQNI